MQPVLQKRTDRVSNSQFHLPLKLQIILLFLPAFLIIVSPVLWVLSHGMAPLLPEIAGAAESEEEPSEAVPMNSYHLSDPRKQSIGLAGYPRRHE